MGRFEGIRGLRLLEALMSCGHGVHRVGDQGQHKKIFADGSFLTPKKSESQFFFAQRIKLHFFGLTPVISGTLQLSEILRNRNFEIFNRDFKGIRLCCIYCLQRGIGNACFLGVEKILILQGDVRRNL